MPRPVVLECNLRTRGSITVLSDGSATISIRQYTFTSERQDPKQPVPHVQEQEAYLVCYQKLLRMVRLQDSSGVSG